MRCRRAMGWWLIVVGVAPLAAMAQLRTPRDDRLAQVTQWIGITASETVEGGVGRLWDLPGLQAAATEAMGAALAREALRPAGPETPVTREGPMLRWGWCRRNDCAGFGYVLVADPQRGDLYICRNAEAGRQGWMGTDPRMFIPFRGQVCDAANVSEFIRLNARP
ncbi:MAG: hypothetical protein KIT36_24385 [Alphaproteobacteria bacterium]|nr:hypothetical protein [Alphaproteobacteria bacterium]